MSTIQIKISKKIISVFINIYVLIACSYKYIPMKKFNHSSKNFQDICIL